MTTVRRISVGSAAKVGAMVSLLITAVFGLIFLLLYGAFLSIFMDVIQEAAVASSPSGATLRPSDVNFMQTAGIAGLCIGYVIQLIFSAIFGGIGGIIFAIAYNLTARWFGGLEVEFERNVLTDLDPGYKPKRTDVGY